MCREVGIPHPVPPRRIGAGAVCGPPGYALFRGHLPHVLGRAAAFQLPFCLPDEGGWYAFSRVSAAAASNAHRPTASHSRLGDLSQLPPRPFCVRTFAATSRLATLSCSSPRSSPPSLASSAPRNTAPPLRAALTQASTCSTAISLSTPNGVASLRLKASKIDPFRAGGRPCASAAPAPLSVPSPRYTSYLAHTPHFVGPLFRVPGRVILDPGPLGAHPPRGIPFLLRPEHPLLPHLGRVRRGCQGLLLGHAPGPRAMEERLPQSLRVGDAPPQICVPSPATHVEVFGPYRGVTRRLMLPEVGTSCSVYVICALGSSGGGRLLGRSSGPKRSDAYAGSAGVSLQ